VTNVFNYQLIDYRKAASRLSIAFSRPYFRVLAGVFPYFTNKFKDLTKKKKKAAGAPFTPNFSKQRRIYSES